MVDTEALGAQAAAAWESCAPSLVLPGQQLSSVTFDCGVSVTINRSDVAAVAGSSSSDEDEGAEATAAAAAAGEYYVRVTLPADFGRDCILHWAVENWELPSPACRPPNSKQVGSVPPVCRRARGGCHKRRLVWGCAATIGARSRLHLPACSQQQASI
jgi:hypothetical protein